MSKVSTGPSAALEGVLRDGMTIAAGGFGLSGIPVDLIEAVRESGVRDLTVVSNNMGVDGKGLGVLINPARSARSWPPTWAKTSSSPSGSWPGTWRSNSPHREPWPTAARRRGRHCRLLHPHRRGHPGRRRQPHADFDGVTYVQERGIVADLALVRAHTADTDGNLIYRYTARNFNPVVATCGRVTIAEVEDIVEPWAAGPWTTSSPRASTSNGWYWPSYEGH